jgi:hydroxymethylbilane synthase
MNLENLEAASEEMKQGQPSPEPSKRPIRIATRGSALALAQANLLLACCRGEFPELDFEICVIKTTGDKLQTASLSAGNPDLPKGLFTKELETALLEGQAELAVHSLKDLPTELPEGLVLGAVLPREDVRDVLIYRAETPGDAAAPRGLKPHAGLMDLPREAVIGSGSNRRKAQLLAVRPDLKVIEHRGNVPTRIEKLARMPEVDAIVLAAAGLARLNFAIGADGRFTGANLPGGLLASLLDLDLMLPCVGQGAIGIEILARDSRAATICRRINHLPTFQCVTAERAFLSAMGGGCQSPVAAHGEIIGEQLRLRAVSFQKGPAKSAEISGTPAEAKKLGEALADRLK